MKRSRLRVLLVDDDDDDGLLTRSLLGGVDNCIYDLDCVQTYEQGQASLANNSYDAVLVDYYLGARSGLDFIREGQQLGHSAPMILLTGQPQEEIDVQALQAGAADYIEKAQLTRPVLDRSIRYALERTRYLTHLAESASFLRSTLNAISKYITIIDQAGLILETNRAWDELALKYGFTLTRVGDNYLDALDAGADARQLTSLRSALQQATAGATTPIYVEYPWNANGRTVWFSSRVDSFSIGSRMRVIVAYEDITSRRAAEEQLRVSEKRLARAQHIAKMGHWERDAETGSLLWSDEAGEVFGIRTNAPSLASVYALVHPEDHANLTQAVERCLKDRTPYEVEYRVVQGETIRVVHERGEYESAGDSERPRLVGTVQDVTDWRELEERFRHSQKMDAIGRLAGGIAHDFNNLLTIILGYCSAILTTPPEDAPLRHAIQSIHDAGERAAALTRELLAVSRKQVIRAEVIDLGMTVARLESMLRRVTGQDITLTISNPGDLHKVRAGRGQIDRILMNLVVNARDALPRGGRITIRARNVALDGPEAARVGVPGAGAYVEITVADTGTGIDPATQSRIFEPFFTTKDPGKGTGLGLSTVYGIVKQNGGAITVTSALNVGSTFSVYLPACDSPGPFTMPPQNRERVSSGLVLVVEDDPALNDLVRTVLSDAGFQVIAATSPGQLETATANLSGQPDLLLTDVVMSGCNGPAIARRLLQRWPALPVIYMSGYAETSVMDLQKLHPQEFLPKPFSHAELHQRVQNAIVRPPKTVIRAVKSRAAGTS